MFSRDCSVYDTSVYLLPWILSVYLVIQQRNVIYFCSCNLILIILIETDVYVMYTYIAIVRDIFEKLVFQVLLII